MCVGHHAHPLGQGRRDAAPGVPIEFARPPQRVSARPAEIWRILPAFVFGENIARFCCGNQQYLNPDFA
jgi:hypothetical protein